MFCCPAPEYIPLTLTALDEMVSSAHSRLTDRELRTLLFSLRAEMQDVKRLTGWFQ